MDCICRELTGAHPAQRSTPAAAREGGPRLHAELLRQFDAGRQTAVEWEEISELLAETAPA